MKTTFTYDHYFVYHEIEQMLHHFAQTYPSLMTYQILTTTPQNRHVFAITITDSASGDAITKPAYYMDGNTHAGEVTGSMAVLHMIDVLLTNHNDDAIKKLLQSTTFYMIPRISCDGAETYLTTPYMVLSVDRPYSNEVGLHQQDIDGDGVIRKMRIKNPAGTWKESANDPRVMVKRCPDDVDGVYYDVFDEGVFPEYQGGDIKVANPTWGMNFNRNYPYGWFVDARQPGAGDYPLCNPETKAVVDFVLAHPNIGFVATMHTTGGFILYPPGTKPAAAASAHDVKMFLEVGAMGTEEMGYPAINIFDGFMEDQKFYASGAFDDWCYHTQGIPAYTLELWNMQERAGIEEVWNPKKTDEQKAINFAKEVKWIDEHIGPDGVKPWTPFMHPDLGEVEIGGYNFKFINQNCPNSLLLEEVEKTTRFCLRNANVLPKLQVTLLESKETAANVHQIKVEVANVGYLPTYLTDEAEVVKKATPIKVECESKQVLSKNMVELDVLEGYSRTNSKYSYYGITSGNQRPQKAVVTFLVSGQKGDTVIIKASNAKAGISSLSVTLN